MKKLNTIKFKLSVLLVFVAGSSYGQFQTGKLDYSFGLGKITYAVFESHNASKSVNDTVYYKLYRLGNPKPVANEIKYVVNKNNQDTLKSGYYNIAENSIIFFQITKKGSVVQRLYTQNSKGLLTLKTSYPVITPPMVPKPVYHPEPVNDNGPRKVEDLSSHPPTVDAPRTSSNKIDQEPEFPGGTSAFRRYLAANVQYPKEARENNIEGRVIVNFVVETDGSIAKIEIERKLGYGCDEEVIRVLKKMPKWKPAQSKGKPIRTNVRFPVTFMYTE
ncbi:energy transducer TonB [Pedobacter punctiformis]|uniref:Energy transducer TonB n=1 Tax=Pedobacter punctiformis TaxID=3004097 RepID=A0ABT4LFI8_9SPHI|nr:energy transducer TonB [Pedobacter sp. HCMS5-2]MCZ4245913.1 energy transducer TonB [Pedobacter sp. HCMS5-2]